MTDNETLEGVLDEQQQAARQFFENEYEAYYLFSEGRLEQTLGNVNSHDPQRLKPLVEKALLTIIKLRLDDDPGWNQSFRRQTGWSVLDQLLTVVRLQELAAVKLTKKGGRGSGLRYDIGQLSKTYYGKSILDALGMSRRKVATTEELETIRAACRKIKLELPEITEPTTTDRYFAGEEIA